MLRMFNFDNFDVYTKCKQNYIQIIDRIRNVKIINMHSRERVGTTEFRVHNSNAYNLS